MEVWWRLYTMLRARVQRGWVAMVRVVRSPMVRGARTTVAHLPDAGRLVLRLDAGHTSAGTRHDPMTGATVPLDLVLARPSAEGRTIVAAKTPMEQDRLVVIRA